MENITIEKMEIKRFNALLMRTIVGMLFMGVLVWETFCLDTGRKGFLGETWYIFAATLSQGDRFMWLRGNSNS